MAFKSYQTDRVMNSVVSHRYSKAVFGNLVPFYRRGVFSSTGAIDEVVKGREKYAVNVPLEES
jgi:hypothetical protein